MFDVAVALWWACGIKGTLYIANYINELFCISTVDKGRIRASSIDSTEVVPKSS